MAEEADKIATIVRVLSAYRDLTSSGLAARIGISSQVMSNRMNGRAPFSVDELKAIATVLDVDPSVFFDVPENVFRHLRPAGEDEPRSRWGSPEPESEGGGVLVA